MGPRQKQINDSTVMSSNVYTAGCRCLNTHHAYAQAHSWHIGAHRETITTIITTLKLKNRVIGTKKKPWVYIYIFTLREYMSLLN